MIVADSDVLVDFLRGKGASKVVAHELRTGVLATTAVTVFELWCGVHSAKQAESVRLLLDAMTILPLTPMAAECAGQLKSKMDKTGKTIASADALIAGICLANDGRLLTRNIRHFADVPGLTLYQLLGD